MKNVVGKLDRQDLLEAIRLVSKELKKKKKNDYWLRKNRIQMVCGSREYQLGRFNSHQSHNCSTSCNMLLNELRCCVGRGNWSAATTLVKFILKMSNNLTPVIWRTSFLILLNHENASHQRLNDFLEQCLGLRSVLEKRSFLTEIFSANVSDISINNRKNANLTNLSLLYSSMYEPNQTKMEPSESE